MKYDKTNQLIYKKAKPILSVYKRKELSLLPSWITCNLKQAKVYGSKNKCIIMPDGNKYHLDNKLNDMNGRDWTLFINSAFETHYPTKGKESYAHNIRKIHPTPKPPQLTKEIIEFFTKENELVFDCFCGVGGSLLGASLCNRDAIGIDLNKKYLNAYLRACKQLNLKIHKTICVDCLSFTNNTKKMNDLFKNKKISLMLIDPPYSNMMSKVKTGGSIKKYGKKSSPFSDSEKDLGNMDRNTYLLSLKQVVQNTLPFVKTKGYIVIFIKDLQPKKKELNLLHSEIIQKLNEIDNIYYKGLKIWVDKSAKLFPYGYPFSFVANQIHQYILIFRKEK